LSKTALSSLSQNAGISTLLPILEQWMSCFDQTGRRYVLSLACGNIAVKSITALHRYAARFDAGHFDIVVDKRTRPSAGGEAPRPSTFEPAVRRGLRGPTRLIKSQPLKSFRIARGSQIREVPHFRAAKFDANIRVRGSAERRIQPKKPAQWPPSGGSFLQIAKRIVGLRPPWWVDIYGCFIGRGAPSRP
jgi:hypothetical protein